MVRRSLIALLVLGGLILGAGRAVEAPWARVGPGGPTDPGAGPDPRTPREVQPNRFYDPTLFYGGLQAAARERPDAPAPPPGRLAGGLVPHHNLAAELLSRFFLQLEQRPPATVIVVGPNHENTGQPVLTGRRGWQTDFGVVAADQDLIDSLVEAGLAIVDDRALTIEHSIGALMPYLKYHAPDARVVPIVLHRDVDRQVLHRLAGALAEALGDDRLLIASVDFSHYLTRAEAEAKDVETLQAIYAFDLDGLMRMGSDHVDSPGSLSVLMLAMRELGADGPHLTGHTNSGILLKSDTIETTSYFTFTYISSTHASTRGGIPRQRTSFPVEFMCSLAGRHFFVTNAAG